MAHTIRAKFKCHKIEKTQDAVETARLYPVKTGSPENDQFFKYTPAGAIELSVTNPDVHGFFEPAKSYYVDFTREGD